MESPFPRPSVSAVVTVMLACLPASVLPAAAGRGATLDGPVAAQVLRVIDGDTLLAEALIWPGQTLTVSIRIRGIYAPEIKGRCMGERLAAARAREGLAVLVADGSVSLSNIGGGKYYGRVLADVATSGGKPVGPALLARALVRPYGGGRRQGWCG